jgi:methylamine utilization protein MauE
VSALAGAASVVTLLGAFLLAASGYTKIRRPLAFAKVLYALELPASLRNAQVIGGLECVVGIAGVAAFVTSTHPFARGAWLAEGGAYLVFFVFLAWAMLGPRDVGSCGCIGATDLPPSWVHAIGNAVIACGAIWASSLPGPIRQALAQSPYETALSLGLTGSAAYLSYLALLRTTGPQGLRRRT